MLRSFQAQDEIEAPAEAQRLVEIGDLEHLTRNQQLGRRYIDAVNTIDRLGAEVLGGAKPGADPAANIKD